MRAKFEEYPTCPKCLSIDVEMTYDDPFLPGWVPSLLCECARCHYEWNMECADADAPESPGAGAMAREKSDKESQG